MTHPADALRERLARTKKKSRSKSGGNGKLKSGDILETSTPHDKTVADNSSKDTPPVKAEKKAKMASKPKKAVAKKPSTKKVAAKKPKAKPKKVTPKKTTPVKTRKVKTKPKRIKKLVGRKKRNDKVRTLDRDRSGDGLRPIEREIIEAVANSDEILGLGILDIAHDMFGPKCGSEGPNSVRTIRNAVRIPIRYGILEHSSRGRLSVTKAYERNEGDLKSIMNSYKEQARAA